MSQAVHQHCLFPDININRLISKVKNNLQTSHWTLWCLNCNPRLLISYNKQYCRKILERILSGAQYDLGYSSSADLSEPNSKLRIPTGLALCTCSSFFTHWTTRMKEGLPGLVWQTLRVPPSFGCEYRLSFSPLLHALLELLVQTDLRCCLEKPTFTQLHVKTLILQASPARNLSPFKGYFSNSGSWADSWTAKEGTYIPMPWNFTAALCTGWVMMIHCRNLFGREFKNILLWFL